MDLNNSSQEEMLHALENHPDMQEFLKSLQASNTVDVHVQNDQEDIDFDDSFMDDVLNDLPEEVFRHIEETLANNNPINIPTNIPTNNQSFSSLLLTPSLDSPSDPPSSDSFEAPVPDADADADADPGPSRKKPRVQQTGDIIDKTVMHNNVQITHPDILSNFFSTHDPTDPLYPDEQIMKDIRNVEFDTSQSGHAPARAACHTMKVLNIIHHVYKIPLADLLYTCGSIESHKCQAIISHKKKGQCRCSSTCVAGEFFCAHHRKNNTMQDGLSAFIQNRNTKK